MLWPRILPVFLQCGTQGFPASCKALEAFLCGRFPPLANVLFKFGVHASLALKKTRSLVKPSFSQRGFIDFSAFPPDLVIVAIGIFLLAAVCVHETHTAAPKLRTLRRVSQIMIVFILCCKWRWDTVLRTRILSFLHLFCAVWYFILSASLGRANSLSLGLFQS